MEDIVDVLKNVGYGVVEGKEAVLAKIQSLPERDFDKAVNCLRKANVPGPYKVICSPD